MINTIRTIRSAHELKIGFKNFQNNINFSIKCIGVHIKQCKKHSEENACTFQKIKHNFGIFLIT